MFNVDGEFNKFFFTQRMNGFNCLNLKIVSTFELCLCSAMSIQK